MIVECHYNECEYMCGDFCIKTGHPKIGGYIRIGESKEGYPICLSMTKKEVNKDEKMSEL